MQKLKRPELSKRIESRLSDWLTQGRRLTQRLGLSQKSLMTTALIVGCLILSLTLSGCQTQKARSLPQQADPRPLPAMKGKTYRDALLYIPELRESFMACEADKAAIRKALSDE